MTEKQMRGCLEDIRKILSEATDKNKYELKIANLKALKRITDFYIECSKQKKPKNDAETIRRRRIAACMHILEVAEAVNAERATLKQAHIVDGMQTFCDGCRFVMLKKSLPFEETTDNSSYINYRKLFDKVNKYDLSEIQVPTVKELKSLVGSYTETKGKCIDLCDSKLSVDSLYLLSMLEAIPNAKVYWDGNAKHHLVFRNAEGDKGILCPISKTV